MSLDKMDNKKYGWRNDLFFSFRFTIKLQKKSILVCMEKYWIKSVYEINYLHSTVYEAKKINVLKKILCIDVLDKLKGFCDQIFWNFLQKELFIDLI